MNIYERIGVRPLINAVDTYTIIGGSLMPQEVMDAMVEASRHFVNLEELHDKAGQRLAALTKNESAFITGGAAAAMALATAACITDCDPAKVDRLPDLDGMKNEVIVHRSQRNGYDHAIRQVGVKLVEIGNVDGTYPWQLESAITDHTACIFYFDSFVFSRGALPLATVIDIGRKHGIPVIVDAAAQLPPVENLWKYTEMGAAAAIFSGGKTLRGPQSTGLIVGKRELIEACRMNSSPRHSLGRSMKLGKEEIVGLLAAVERYMALDHDKVQAELESHVAYIQAELRGTNWRVERIFPGPAGQAYPRAAIYIPEAIGITAPEIREKLADGTPGIIVGMTDDNKGIIVNPLNLERSEVQLIMERIQEICSV